MHQQRQQLPRTGTHTTSPGPQVHAHLRMHQELAWSLCPDPSPSHQLIQLRAQCTHAALTEDTDTQPCRAFSTKHVGCDPQPPLLPLVLSPALTSLMLASPMESLWTHGPGVPAPGVGGKKPSPAPVAGATGQGTHPPCLISGSGTNFHSHTHRSYQ